MMYNIMQCRDRLDVTIREDVEIKHRTATVVGVSNVLHVTSQRHHAGLVGVAILDKHAASGGPQVYFLPSSPLTFSHSLSVLT